MRQPIFGILIFSYLVLKVCTEGVVLNGTMNNTDNVTPIKSPNHNEETHIYDDVYTENEYESVSHIYEEITEWAKDKLEEDDFSSDSFDSSSSSYIQIQYQCQKKMPENGKILQANVYKNNVQDAFKNYVTDLKKDKNLQLDCLNFVKMTQDQFDTSFRIQFYPFVLFKKTTKKYYFFLEFKKTLTEVLFFASDQEERIIKSLSITKTVFSEFCGMLRVLYEIVCDNNNLETYLKDSKFQSKTDECYENKAIETLNDIFLPDKFPLRFNKLINWLVMSLDENTKKSKILKKGFRYLDMIHLKIDKQKKLYRARYYIIATLFNRLIS